MISVVIIGGGNVAFHLTKAFLSSKNVVVCQLYARNISSISEFQHQTSLTDNIHMLDDADVYILAISDDAIPDVSQLLPKEKLVVHTSGSVAMNALENTGRKGIFYPLQSFSKTKDVDFKEIPLCIEAENDTDLHVLERLASEISEKVYHITSDQRSKLHVAAVFVNNFTNHMYKIGNDICKNYDVPFDVLFPLIKETAAKIESLDPSLAQTGPAKRNDQETIERHLSLLNSNQKDIYKLITKSIQNG
ncbi:Rossmann-like and DUF2520 domain-containing protein [Tenacibaculum agarivorans]|uniref:Rossmann-like and DUF2520 domain-containing protein n=1 Tax=Tenacibaculum agarivorans TaxID=1908389 RepID=UPI00094BAA79|nr:Rossmann-like and DUF2520 domain-containing protein [Tenacibaculum agarivorans]